MKFIKTFNEAKYERNVNSNAKLEYIDHISKWRKPGEDEIYSIISGGDTNVVYVNDKFPDEKIIDTVIDFKRNFERISDPKIDDMMRKPAKEAPWQPPVVEEPTKQVYVDDNDVELDFNEGFYLAGEKAIIGAYFITGEDDDYIDVLNIKEYTSQTATFADATPYSVTIHYFRLPKKKVLVLDKVDGKEGFSYIKIPYWLYKENPDLAIKRCKAPRKRLDLRDISLNNKELMSKFNDPNVEKYFIGSNPDDRTLKLVEIYRNQYANR